jgi:LmbE family N-acetylglucosaminyl deacetylase
MSLDFLVVASHPDDAELCLGGTILSLKHHNFTVGVLDLTDGEPTPHGSVEIRQQETAAATAILGLDWRGNLRLPNRSLEATLEARSLSVRSLLGGCPPRPRCRQRPHGCGPLLGQTLEINHSRRAALSPTDSLLL